MTAKTIRVFLADGEPTGILLAEISNWTGKVLVASRSQLDQISKRVEVRRTGVYLLVGSDPDDPSRALAYIGEGDNVFRRLLRHNRNKESTGWSCWESGRHLRYALSADISRIAAHDEGPVSSSLRSLGLQDESCRTSTRAAARGTVDAATKGGDHADTRLLVHALQ